MLINDINPKYSVYYLGAMVLKILKYKKEYTCDFLELYIQLKENYDVTLSLFTFTLDWLYLISAVSFDDKKGVVTCTLNYYK